MTASALDAVAAAVMGVEMTGDAETDRRSRVARALDYAPRSGLRPDWDRAVAEDVGTAQTLTVPLLGTDIAELSKVSYIAAGGRMTIVEMASSSIDADHAGLRMWEDGVQTRDVVVSRSTADSGSSTVVQAAWSFDKFKDCLNRNGVMWATLSLLAAVCGVVCAVSAGTGCLPCAAAVLGGNIGAIGTCAAAASR